MTIHDKCLFIIQQNSLKQCVSNQSQSQYTIALPKPHLPLAPAQVHKLILMGIISTSSDFTLCQLHINAKLYSANSVSNHYQGPLY